MSTLIQPEPMPRVARRLRRAATTFDAHAAVHENVAARLRERLDLLAVTPRRVLDLGCRSGYQLEALGERYPEARITGADPAPGRPSVPPSSWPAWLRRRPRPVPRVAADPHRLPFADGSFDLVVSNLLLPWCQAPHAVFGEVARVLDTGGAFLFTSAGPDTLREYRAAWARIDAHLHGFGLIDMHDLGDALQEELRGVGAFNVALGRRPGLMSPSVRAILRDAGRGGEGGKGAVPRFPVTLELVQGHAWKGEPTAPNRGADGESFVSLDSLRDSLPGRSEGR